MSSFDSDDFLHEDYYETNGNFYSANGVYQGECVCVGGILRKSDGLAKAENGKRTINVKLLAFHFDGSQFLWTEFTWTFGYFLLRTVYTFPRREVKFNDLLKKKTFFLDKQTIVQRKYRAA